MSYGTYPIKDRGHSVLLEGPDHKPPHYFPRTRLAISMLILTTLILSITLAVILCFFVDFSKFTQTENCSDLCNMLPAEDSTLKTADIASPAQVNRGRGLEPAGDTLLMGIISDIHLAVVPDKECRTSATFGLYGCDSNEALVNATLDDMSSRLLKAPNHMVLMIGDAAKHQPPDKWDTAVVLENNERFFQLIRDRFHKTPVFPILGNNDLPEHNQLPPKTWYSNFLSNYLGAIHSTPSSSISSLPIVTTPANFNQTFLSGGYYTATYHERSAVQARLTVIALNTVLFHCKINDVMEQEIQASAQLTWLELTLKELGEGRAVIIGHHPLTINIGRLYGQHRVLPDWRFKYYKRFRAIVGKFRTKVAGMFFGHEHIDTMVVERWSGDVVIFGVPSVSPSFSGEPSYQVAVLDSPEMKLRDIKTYNTWLDMQVHSEKQLQFTGFSSLSDILGVTHLIPAAIKNSIHSLTLKTPQTSDLYQRLKTKMFGGRFFPREMTRQLFYCFSSSMYALAFSECIQKFGYPEDAFSIEIA